MRLRFLLLAALALTSCTFQTLDARRPLVVSRIPTDKERLAVVMKDFPGVEEGKLARSLKLSRAARNAFDIHKYNEWSSFVPVGRLGEAINLVPDNPFAWVQLGAYLALDHQTEAAIMATGRGFELVSAKCAANTCAEDLQRLETTAGINLAIYRSDAERPLEALLALQRIDPANAPPFERLAYFWTAADVKSALGDTEGARAALASAAAITEKELLGSRGLANYPQHFGARRQAIQTYLAAVVDVAAGDHSSAEAQLRDALRLDDRLWDAHLLLAHIHYTRTSYDESIATLRALKRRAPEKEIFRPERLDYNLGNALAARYETTGNPADLRESRDSFEDAAERVERRFGGKQDKADLAGVFRRPETGRFFLDVLATTSPTYADARNNLGTSLVQIGATEGDQDWFRKAEEQWRHALRDPFWPRRQLAYGNLARLYAKSGRLSAAADSAAAALDLDPFNVVPVKALLDVAEHEPDLEMAAQAAHIAGRLIAQRRWQYPAGTFDEIFAPASARLKNGPQTEAVRQALWILDYALADDDATSDLIARAHAAFPAWSWPAVEIARARLAEGQALEQAEEFLKAMLAKKVPPHDWIGKREQGDALLLRAEIRERLGISRPARRDIERALAAGVSRPAIESVRARVDARLEAAREPIVSSFAVLPFDRIYSGADGKWGHSLASTFSVMLRAAGSVTVRSLERDALDIADWNAHSAADLGRLSGIGAVLTGSYVESNKLVIIHARVLDSVTGEELFSNRYDAPRNDILQLQVRIAEDALAALRLKPTIPLQNAASSSFTASSTAYHEYLSGMEILLSGALDARELRQAEKLMRHAIRSDPKFARAHAGLAFTLYRLSNLHVRPAAIMPEAEEAAERAVELAPNASDAQLALALVRTWYTWDFEAGRKAFNKALELDPYNSTIHRLHGDFLAARGDLDGALAEKLEAMELAPLSAIATLDVGYPFFYKGEYAKALAQADAALTIQPNLSRGHLLEAWVYTETKQYQKALDALDAAWASGKNEPPLIFSHRAVTNVRKGALNQVDAPLNELWYWTEDEKGYVLPLLEARIHAARGNIPYAMEKLWEAYNDRSESMVWLGIDPWFASMRNNPSFHELLARVESAAKQRK